MGLTQSTKSESDLYLLERTLLKSEAKDTPTILLVATPFDRLIVSSNATAFR